MIDNLMSRFPTLNKKNIENVINTIIHCYQNGGTLFACGNGGSFSDAEHISGELMKGFLKKRTPDAEFLNKLTVGGMNMDTASKMQLGLPCIPLGVFGALNSAVSNDNDASLIYAQPLTALGKKGDVLLCISTSGNSLNVVNAAITARALGITVISLTGKSGGKLKELSEICICADETETYKVQEVHLPIYHTVCAAVEQHFFGDEKCEDTKPERNIGASSCCMNVINEDTFKMYSENGIKYMEVSFGGYDQTTDIPFADYRKWADKYGVELWSFHLPFCPFNTLNIASLDETVRDFTVNYLKVLLDEAKNIGGINNAVIHPSGEPIHDGDRSACMKQAKKSLKELAEHCKKLGVTLAVENLPRTCLGRNSDDILELISADDSLRVCFDTNHLSSESFSSFIKRTGKKIITVHISDYFGENECHLLPGEGTTDFKNLWKELTENGYCGPFMYEVGFGTADENGKYLSKFGNTVILERPRALNFDDFKKAYDEIV